MITYLAFSLEIVMSPNVIVEMYDKSFLLISIPRIFDFYIYMAFCPGEVFAADLSFLIRASLRQV